MKILTVIWSPAPEGIIARGIIEDHTVFPDVIVDSFETLGGYAVGKGDWEDVVFVRAR